MSRFDTEEGLYRTLILLVILSQKDEQYKSTLLKCLDNILDTFNSYNRENDPHDHKRTDLYENILMLGAWILKFFPNTEVYKKVKKLILDYKDLKRDKMIMPMGGRHIEDFIMENYPEENDFLLRHQKIWESKKYCFNDPQFSLEIQDYKKFCDYLNSV